MTSGFFPFPASNKNLLRRACGVAAGVVARKSTLFSQKKPTYLKNSNLPRAYYKSFQCMVNPRSPCLLQKTRVGILFDCRGSRHVQKSPKKSNKICNYRKPNNFHKGISTSRTKIKGMTLSGSPRRKMSLSVNPPCFSPTPTRIFI